MFGSKLRSWMEAVRPRKKQNRKEKHGKNAAANNHCVKFQTPCQSDKPSETQKEQVTQNSSGIIKQLSRYSATNLSSPESAYSTGYSTDGTSPGALPEYSLNSPKNNTLETTSVNIRNASNTIRMSPSNYNKNSTNDSYNSLSPALSINSRNQVKIYDVPIQRPQYNNVSDPPVAVAMVTTPLGVLSPRQRNRIRTNPWLPNGGVPSPIPDRNDLKCTPILSKSARSSPREKRYLSPALRRRSISSSSCSSVSATSVQLENCRQTSKSLSDDLEDDCTLNEMMGKFDESYIYEKETDILSDSDPTDCESDIDTGQDGGDEEDTVEGEFDFIDNGSYLEFDTKSESNTGHCFYYVPSDVQRKRSSSRKRASRKSDRRRRSSSSKKKIIKFPEREIGFLQESKSAGATPVSVRRSKSNIRSSSRLPRLEFVKKRSNSVCSREPINTIDRKDREADMKYRELIGQAEQIIRTMNVNGLSPRRLPGPANKRVELLRTAECKKEIMPPKDDPAFSKIPSICNTSRFSPKKNHITNFILNHSPILVKKELQMLRGDLTEEPPLIFRNPNAMRSPVKKNDVGFEKSHPTKGILLNSKKTAVVNYYKEGYDLTQSSNCPQSEPMRRKVYFGQDVNVRAEHVGSNGKSVVFNLGANNNDNSNVVGEVAGRQQVLLCTIQDIKRNLENQSASLQQVYRSTQCIYKY